MRITTYLTKIVFGILLTHKLMASVSEEVDILIVGAGPAGLTLARTLEGHDLSFKVVEKNSVTTRLSKATELHADTMKIIETFGLLDQLMEVSVQLNGNVIIHGDEFVRKITFKQGANKNHKNVSLSQEAFEKLLLKGIDSSCILYGHKFFTFKISYEQAQDYRYLSHIKNVKNSQTLWIKSKCIIAADGGRSSIRRQLGFSFPGETTPERAFSFDVKYENTKFHPNMMYMISNDYGRVVFVPIRPGEYKVSGKFNSEILVNPPLEELLVLVHLRSGIALEVDCCHGLVFYHTHSRLASQNYKDQIYLIGDAAHVFFPAGGYGLNLAVQEGFALGNFLIATLKHSNEPEALCFLMDSFYKRANTIRLDAMRKKTASRDMKNKKSEMELQCYHGDC